MLACVRSLLSQAAVASLLPPSKTSLDTCPLCPDSENGLAVKLVLLPKTAEGRQVRPARAHRLLGTSFSGSFLNLTGSEEHQTPGLWHWYRVEPRVIQSSVGLNSPGTNSVLHSPNSSSTLTQGEDPALASMLKGEHSRWARHASFSLMVERSKSSGSGWCKSCFGKLHFMKLDCERFAPKFFSFLKKKNFFFLVQTFKSSVGMVENVHTAPLWGDIPVKESMPISWDARLQIMFMDKRAVHMQQACACVHICVYVFVPSSVLCTSVSVCRTSRNRKDYDSAENTMCRLWAFSSPMSLSPHDALVYWSHSPAHPHHLWPQCRLSLPPSRCNGEGWAGSALLCSAVPFSHHLQTGAQALAPSHSALPKPASRPAGPLQSMPLSVRHLPSVELKPIHVILTFCCMSHKWWNQSRGFWDVASVL